VPPGPSGAPTRGMAHVLPTGRNFYSVDPRSLPSGSAWITGMQLAKGVLARYLKENGSYPESVSISAWGTSAMRTGGDDIAQILYLMGVEPQWQDESRRVVGLKVIPLDKLARPRINVITRISGFFRDAFSHLIYLIDDAVQMVTALDEPEEMNFVRKHFLDTKRALLAAGMSENEADERANFRVFGSKPGSYGAGILGLIQEKNWTDEKDFAETYLNWGGFAYSRKENGTEAREDFARGLSSVQIAIHNQDNREHDIFDSDDYLQFHGGMIATIYSLTGRKPKQYFGDSSSPQASKVRDLKEEAYRVFRTRVVNPKWLAGITQHGYKGALELSATVDYLFGYDATAKVMDDWMYEQVSAEYVFNDEIRRFMENSNPWALQAISERLLEAAKRGLWEKPEPETLYKLQEAMLKSEACLESRGEKKTPGGIKA
jgi:cobaltochelatase CobN